MLEQNKGVIPLICCSSLFYGGGGGGVKIYSYRGVNSKPMLPLPTHAMHITGSQALLSDWKKSAASCQLTYCWPPGPANPMAH